MDIDSLKDILNNFDPTAFFPDLSTLPGKVELAARIAVLIGPLLLLGLGLLYFLAPPKEANYTFGFRTHRGMASVEAWQFTQKIAGIAWSVLGLGLAIVMSILCSNFRGMDVMDMVTRAAIYILWEIGLLLLCGLVVRILVVIFFDRQGNRREKKA